MSASGSRPTRYARPAARVCSPSPVRTTKDGADACVLMCCLHPAGRPLLARGRPTPDRAGESRPDTSRSGRGPGRRRQATCGYRPRTPAESPACDLLADLVGDDLGLARLRCRRARSGRCPPGRPSARSTFRARSVSMYPTCSDVTRVPCGASSTRSALVSDHSAVLGRAVGADVRQAHPGEHGQDVQRLALCSCPASCGAKARVTASVPWKMRCPSPAGCRPGPR